MVMNEALLRELLATFVVEAHEHLANITRDLLSLEKGTGEHAETWLLSQIFREAHSLKGAARAVNLAPIETMAHRLETLFSAIQRGEISPSPRLFDTLYACLDAMGFLVQGAASGKPADVDLDALTARLESLATVPGSSLELTGAFGPASCQELKAGAIDAVPEAPSPRGSVLSQPAESAARTQSWPDTSGGETVRINTAKLDALLAGLGELQAARLTAEERLAETAALLTTVEGWEAGWRKVAPNEFMELNAANLRQLHGDLERLRRNLQSDSRRTGQAIASLQDDVRRARMLPIASILEPFPRMVRDMARSLCKEVQLVVEGGNTEVDRSVLEHLKSPLTHLLRNAVDHGLETPEARTQAGKPAEGTITLRASQRGGTILIQVGDDGAGIDVAKIRQTALAKGLVSAEDSDRMSALEVRELIFRPGFSTSTTVTDISGRGIRLDVVRDQIERLHGLTEVSSELGKGTTFSLSLPLTIATTLCLLIRIGQHQFALPVSGVERIIRFKAGDLVRAEGHLVLRIGQQAAVLVELCEVLELGSVTEVRAVSTRESQPAVVVGLADRRVAFVVDAILGIQELVVKALPRPLQRVRLAAGAAILGTGDVVAVLNASELLRAAARRPATRLSAEPAASKQNPGGAQILVVDDSITTRTLEKNILVAAGYRVQVAADGLAAWDLLQRSVPDLMVCDVNMPRMDGFELAEKVRSDARLQDLPIVIVTSLDSRSDRERGLRVGADAYVVKSAFDQDELLETVRRLI